jgi:hypothetical protein
MSNSVRRGFAGGSISRSAAEKHFDYGTTSDNSTPLTVDDGGLWSGEVGDDHIDTFARTRGGAPRNPEKDFGVRDLANADHIDRRANRGTSYPGSATGKAERQPAWPSTARVRAGSASEYWSDEWYGYPSKRQGG